MNVFELPPGDDKLQPRNVFEKPSPQRANTNRQIFEPTLSSVHYNCTIDSRVIRGSAINQSLRTNSFAVTESHANVGRSVFESPVMCSNHIQNSSNETSVRAFEFCTRSNQAESHLQECERVRCNVCANIVDAIVLERSPLAVKYKCTNPACKSLFVTKGVVTQATTIVSTAITLINLGIGAIKLFSGDSSGLHHLCNNDGHS